MANKKTAPKASAKQAWSKPFTDTQFDFMKQILAAPSPVGLEAAMSYGVLRPFFEQIAPADWALHQFKGNASVVLDTAPDDEDKLSVCLLYTSPSPRDRG